MASTHSPALRHLRDYVALPSVNPMRREDIDPAIVGERRYAEHVLAQLRRLGLDAELVGEAARPSVVATAHARDARETLLIASHLDTVPVDGMQIEPFDPVVRDGRLFGRGACDTKAGMASAVAALERVLTRGTLARNLILVGEADEELSSQGIRDVLDHLEVRPDWLLATEPTGLRAVNRHKGVVHTRLEARGRACHASDPAAGRNAILPMARAVLALEELRARVEARHDPRLGSSSLSIGVIAGGSAANIVPDRAWLLVDHRLLPGEDADSIRADVEAALAHAGVADVSIGSCRMEKAPLSTDDAHPSVRSLQAALGAAGLPLATEAAAFGTDAGLAAERGLPSVVFGPGDVAQAHTAGEYVELAQVDAAVEVFVRLLEGAGL